MSSKITLSVLMLTLALTAGCATPITSSPAATQEEVAKESMLQKTMVLKDTIKNGDKLFNVSYPILTKNSQLCGERITPSIGMDVWNIKNIKWGYRTAARETFGVHSGLTVSYIADKSPAAKAGIKSGDLILAINDQSPKEDDEEANKLLYDELKNSEYKKIKFDLERNGKTFTAFVTPVAACNYPIIYEDENTDLNAWADGQSIHVTKTIIKFTENDNELALIVSHEMAHNVMQHIDKQTQNAIIGGIGGLAVDAILIGAGVSTGNEFSRFGQNLGASAYSIDFEKEADYVGMYFMERSGYNSKNVADVWRRFALESPQSVTRKYTHPTTPERYLAINRAYEEIKSKKAKGIALIPEGFK